MVASLTDENDKHRERQTKTERMRGTRVARELYNGCLVSHSTWSSELQPPLNTAACRRRKNDNDRQGGCQGVGGCGAPCMAQTNATDHAHDAATIRYELKQSIAAAACVSIPPMSNSLYHEAKTTSTPTCPDHPQI